MEKAAADHWAAVLLGLRKLSDDPYMSGPVGEEVTRLAKLAAGAAHVKFSIGERHGGVTLLLDGLKMTDRIRNASPSLSSRCETTILQTFSRGLDAIPLLECDRVRASLDPILLNPSLSRKERSQLALLRLHMRIEAYRWKHLNAPGLLAEAAPATEIEDPATKRPFKLEITTAGYRLQSEEFGPLGTD